MKNNPLDITSLFLQMISLEILFKDFNNTDLMQELRQQDTNYLEKIIEQNNKIIKLLESEGNYGRKRN